jgi:uncharacterized Zn-binding protein involved in type VI secretion
MFVSLSRRSGSLLERLLRLIDSLELGEQDSERLADLFRMDHLATRMRRNSENLLVLAGQEPPRRWAEPVSLADVVRASVSEIEQYDRVVLDMQPGLAITGNAVADTVHLLAEIIENATTFSAKGTQVAVSGHSLRSGGVLISVIDSGMGMTEDQLAQVNWRLENPPVADVEVSRHMGLFAVAHLAERHGIRVRLKAATGGGLIARVWLPGALISHDGNPASWDHIRTGRASAMIQAVTRTARFPQDPASTAAASLAGAPFTAAPLAEMTLATPPWEALRTTEPPAEKPATTPPEETPWTTAPPEEAPRATTPAEEQPGTATSAAEAPADAPAAEMPATTPPDEAPRTTALAAETPPTAPEEEPHAGPAAEEQPRTTTSAAGAPADAPPEETARVVVPTPRLRPREARLPIFESVESDWFRARRTAPAHAGATVDPHGAERSWISPGDEGWRAAETVLAPAVGGITPSGLPRRTPKANLVPGAAGAREDRPARAADSADVVSKRLAGFQRGSRRARDAPGAQSSGEQE